MFKLAIYVGVPFLLGVLAFYAAIGPRWRLPVVRRFPALAIYCLLVSFFSPSLPIHLALCSLIVPIFANRREEVVPVYLFALLTMPGVGMTVKAGSLDFVSLSGLSTLGIGAAVWSLVKGERGLNRSALAGICIAALFVMIVFSGARGTSATNYLRVIVANSLAFLMPFYIVRRCVKSPADTRLLIISLIAVTAGLSAVAVFEAKTSWPLFRAVYDHYGVPLGSGASVKLRGGYLRSPGPFIEPTSFGLWLALGTGALLTAPWLFTSRTKYTLLRALLIVGLFAPQSRGAWLGLICFFAIQQLAGGKSASVIKPLIAASAAALTFYCLALFVPALGNMLGLNSEGGVGHDYRQDLFQRGIEEAKHHLWLGTDFDTISYALRDLVQGEGIIDFVNSYLFTLLTTGLVGLFLFLFALFSPLPAMFRLARSVSTEERVAPSFVIAALSSIAVMIAFTALGSRTNTAICIMIALSGSLLNARRAPVGATGVNSRAAGLRRNQNIVRIGGPPTPENPIVHRRSDPAADETPS